MFGVGRIEDLNIAERWRSNDPVTSLAVPIGIGTDGAEFMLDLHQSTRVPMDWWREPPVPEKVNFC